MQAYLDNSATTQVAPTAAAAMAEMLEQLYGNPASLHRMGFLAEQRVTAACRMLGRTLGCREEELTFTGSGSEANNLAVLGALRALRRRGNGFVTTAVEHSSLLGAAAQAEAEGFAVTRVGVASSGSVSPEAIAHAVDDQTLLVSVMLVNSETGAVNDLAAIAAAVRRKNPNVLLHSDCVQGFGRMPVEPARWGVDMVTLSGHKIHGPKGIAALYHRKGVRLLPLYYSASQGEGLRPGTPNTPGIVAMGVMAEELHSQMADNHAHYVALRQRLIEKISQLPGLCINSPSEGAPYILNLSLTGLRSEVLIHYLEAQGLYLSSGSACSRGAKSHVLTAMGLSPDRIDSALRVSFCRNTTAEEVDWLAHWLEQATQELRRTDGNRKKGTSRTNE